MIKARVLPMIITTALVLFVGCTNNQKTLQSLDLNDSVAVPQVVTVRIKGYSPASGKAFQDVFVSNFSVTVDNGQLIKSTGRDGLGDDLKNSLFGTYGFSSLSPESAMTSFADLFLFKLGLTQAQQSLLYCSPSQLLSSSNDAFTFNDSRLAGTPLTFLGLRDCEKVYLQLNPNLWDNAGNGVPDYLKLRCGLNPTAKNDAFRSTAGDGLSNLEKCKRHIPLTESAATAANQAYAYQYRTEQNVDGTLDFVISNIPVVDTGEDNFIALYLTESDQGGGAPALRSAFFVLPAASAGKEISIDYWAVDPAHYTNVEITLP